MADESAPAKDSRKDDNDGKPAKSSSKTSMYRRKGANGGCCSFGKVGPTSSGSSVSRQSVSRSTYHQNIKSGLKSDLNINLVFTAFIIVFGTSFQFGYNIGVLNQIKYLIVDFQNETYRERHGSVSEGTLTTTWSLTTSVFVPGGMVGAFLGGAIADTLGRKKSIIFAQAFTIIGGIFGRVCTTTKSPELLMAARFFFGITSGIGNCLAPMFLTEITPYNLRGAFGTVHQLFITFGIFMSSIFGLKAILGTRELWPYLLLIEIVPAVTTLLVMPWLPESPRFLFLSKKNRKAAETALKFYRRSEDVTMDLEEMDTEHQEKTATSSEAEQSFTLKDLFGAKDLRRPLFIACALQVIQQFSGINAVFFYSTSIFKNAGVKDSDIPYAVISTNAVNVAMTIITVPLMDIAGRRKLLLWPMVMMNLDLILITISLTQQGESIAMSYLCIAGIILYVIGFAVGLGPIPMMIGSELFRQGPRPLVMATAGVVNWVTTFIVGMTFEHIQNALKQYTFLLFLAMMIVFTVFVFLKVPETKNLTFEEIAHQFSPGTNIEVEIFAGDTADGVEERDAPGAKENIPLPVTVNVTPDTPPIVDDEASQVAEDLEEGQ